MFRLQSIESNFRINNNIDLNRLCRRSMNPAEPCHSSITQVYAIRQSRDYVCVTSQTTPDNATRTRQEDLAAQASDDGSGGKQNEKATVEQINRIHKFIHIIVAT